LNQFSKQDFKIRTILPEGGQNASYSIVCAHQGTNSFIDFSNRILRYGASPRNISNYCPEFNTVIRHLSNLMAFLVMPWTWMIALGERREERCPARFDATGHN
jgi:hypothetical protein